MLIGAWPAEGRAAIVRVVGVHRGGWSATVSRTSGSRRQQTWASHRCRLSCCSWRRLALSGAGDIRAPDPRDVTCEPEGYTGLGEILPSAAYMARLALAGAW